MEVNTLPPVTATHDYSLGMRLWHWANAALISGQLLTILFLKVIVNTKAAGPEFQKALAPGVTLSQQQSRALGHVISERIWSWHIGIGLTLAGAWLLWTLMQALDPAGRRFGARLVAAARRYRLAQPQEHADARHVLLAKLTYAAFYLFVTIMVVTGLGLTWADDVPWLHGLEHTVKEVHNITMYLIIAYIVVHVVGVVWADNHDDRGLVSRMVSGEDPRKADQV
jgi:Ni,Fe-hydrogenase I cytochrome b subunit